jgi:hypothetical protein
MGAGGAAIKGVKVFINSHKKPSAAKPQPKVDRRKPANQLPQKQHKKGRCVLSVINRAPIGAAVSLPAKSYFPGNWFAALISAREIIVYEEAFFMLFFVAIDGLEKGLF